MPTSSPGAGQEVLKLVFVVRLAAPPGRARGARSGTPHPAHIAENLAVAGVGLHPGTLARIDSALSRFTPPGHLRPARAVTPVAMASPTPTLQQPQP
ncbi:hypothetical protein GCM10010260_61180 [Streptomyces filipinensis]|uniref:Uncharacterized protein n=1 Tax=Streptomyces filipinensis TaxID=66887 RepID=A0A918IGB3_9ACTN|nr:hypothetical protein GCM10010260_61180 [Streptomyces filipinensis]